MVKLTNKLSFTKLLNFKCYFEVKPKLKMNEDFYYRIGMPVLIISTRPQ